MEIPNGIPISSLPVVETGRMPNHLNTSEFFSEKIGYSAKTDDGKEWRVCAVCDLAWETGRYVLVHRGMEHRNLTNRGKGERTLVSAQREAPPETPPEPGLSSINLPGVHGDWVALADTMLARVLRGLAAQRDDALAKVAPLEAENERLDKENGELVREIKRLERELAPFRKAAERMAEKILREAATNGDAQEA